MHNQAQSLETPACARPRIAAHHNLATICVLMKGNRPAAKTLGQNVCAKPGAHSLMKIEADAEFS
jgi:hypothetical protein